MKKSSLQTSILFTVLASALWLAGSWWHYACNIKNTCSTSNTSVSDPNNYIQDAKTLSDENYDKNSIISNGVDTDDDGLTDLEESKLGTDPLLLDTDRDSISDSEEVGVNLDTPLDSDEDGLIDALDADDDNDGLSTLNEEKIGTSSLHADTDEDGILDSVEIGQDPTAPLDTDGDGIINALDTDDDDDNIDTIQEALLGTNHLLRDTDGDGISDAQELGDLMDEPLDSDRDGILDAVDTDEEKDQDNDGLPDSLEARLNTDPSKADSDGDGINDAIEVGKDIYEPLDSDLDGIIDALDTVDDLDSDNDGLLDSLELTLKSNPKSADSDDDGINDLVELGDNKTDPLDTDKDGVLNLNDEDDDNDKLLTRYEIQIGTNPLLNDTDKDSLLDGDEAKLPSSDELQDTDNDKIINPKDADDDNDTVPTLNEIALGTNPLLADSDKDGISDAEEIGSDYKSAKDTDKDGIIDALDTTDDLLVKAEIDIPVKMADIEVPIKMADIEVPVKMADIEVPVKMIGKKEVLVKMADLVKNSTTDPKTDLKKDEDIKDSASITTNTDTDTDTDKALSIELKGDPLTDSIQSSILYFPYYSYSVDPLLKSDAKEYLDKVVDWLKSNPENIIELVGHTDSKGSKKKNLALGIRRVMVVRELLINRGASMAQIDVMSRGESEPLASNKDEAGRIKNRRVEISPLKR